MTPDSTAMLAPAAAFPPSGRWPDAGIAPPARHDVAQPIHAAKPASFGE